jgi:hypothetical protein
MRQLVLAAMLAFGGAATASAGGVHVSVNFGGPYYGYAPADVVYVERYVPVYEVPRVLYVSRYGRVPPAVVVGHYRGGWGWNRIYDRYRVPRAAYYRGGYGYPGYSYRGGYSRGYGRGYYDSRGYRGNYYRGDKRRGRGRDD